MEERRTRRCHARYWCPSNVGSEANTGCAGAGAKKAWTRETGPWLLCDARLRVSRLRGCGGGGRNGPQAVRAENSFQARLQQTGAHRKVQHSKPSANAERLAKAVAKARTRYSNLLRFHRRARFVEAPAQLCYWNQLACQTLLEVEPKSAQCGKLIVELFSGNLLRAQFFFGGRTQLAGAKPFVGAQHPGFNSGPP